MIERVVNGALTAVALWIAANWALAIPMALTRRNLLIAAVEAGGTDHACARAHPLRDALPRSERGS